ncbi:hypothetical protein MNBD_NITROSPIRAE03-1749 [hydrothermal vent metagenome]|uniref:Carboxypeptidase regulatory-like domain-containing protein n=1 Tax=hydrothermal vent metagenome TaxID=652676 RepID=A0A3B1CWC3_9ZZZZ
MSSYSGEKPSNISEGIEEEKMEASEYSGKTGKRVDSCQGWLNQPRTHRKGIASLRGALISFITCLFILIAVTAEAGMVYGRVYGADGAFKTGDTFLLIKKDGGVIKVKTDDSRGYSIIIAPGIYMVQFRKDGTLWEAWIRSFSSPVRQDIHLKKK